MGNHTVSYVHLSIFSSICTLSCAMNRISLFLKGHPGERGSTLSPAPAPVQITGSEVDLETVEGKNTASLTEQPLPFQMLPGGIHPGSEIRRKIHPMMAGQDPRNRKMTDPFHRPGKLLRIGGGIEGVQASRIEQVPGKEEPPRRLVKAAMSRGMSRRVEDLHLPPAQVDDLPVAEPLPCPVRIDAVVLREKPSGKRQGRAIRLARTIWGGSGNCPDTQPASAPCTAV